MNKDWEVLNGPYNVMVKNLRARFPNHLIIVHLGYYYQIYDEDATFFANYFSLNTFKKYNKLTAGFPTFSTKYFSNLRDMEKSFVRVDQLSEKKNGKIQRAISEIFNGKPGDITSTPSFNSTSSIEKKVIKHKNTSKPLSSKNIPTSRTTPHKGKKYSSNTRTTFPENDFPKQYIDEPLGTREDHNKMKGRQGFKNKTGNH